MSSCLAHVLHAGALVAMSSTSIVVKCLNDGRVQGSPAGQISIATLVLQVRHMYGRLAGSRRGSTVNGRMQELHEWPLSLRCMGPRGTFAVPLPAGPCLLSA